MNNNKNILTLIIRSLFFGYFTVWSFILVNIIQRDNADKSLQDIEVYLVPAECSSSLFTDNEVSDQDLLYSGKYLFASVPDPFELTGNYHFIKSSGLFILTTENLSGDHTRPPPFL